MSDDNLPAFDPDAPREVKVRRAALSRHPYSDRQRELAREALDRGREAAGEIIDTLLKGMRGELIGSDAKSQLTAARELADRVGLPKRTERDVRELSVSVNANTTEETAELTADQILGAFSDLGLSKRDRRDFVDALKQRDLMEVLDLIGVAPDSEPQQIIDAGVAWLRRRLTLAERRDTSETWRDIDLEFRALRAQGDPRLETLERVRRVLADFAYAIARPPMPDAAEALIEATAPAPDESLEEQPEVMQPGAPEDEQPEARPRARFADMPGLIAATQADPDLPSALQHDVVDPDMRVPKSIIRHEPDRKW